MDERKADSPGFLGHMIAAVTIAVVTVGGWTIFLGWDQHKHLNSAGTLSGPYEPWQVGALVATVATVAVAVAAVAGTGYWQAAALVPPLILTVCFAVAGANDP